VLPEPGPELTTFQRNDLYERIEEGGLNPAQCDLTDTSEPEKIRTRTVYSFFRPRVVIGNEEIRIPGRRAARITHLPSGSFFDIKIESREQFRSQTVRASSPYGLTAPQKPNCSYTATIAGEQRYAGSDWDWCLRDVRRWATDVKRECVDRDLWAELRRGGDFLGRGRQINIANTPFTPDEQAKIAEQLQNIKEYVKMTYSLSIDQAERVEARFDEAEDASQRIGRKDWLLLFGGALFSLILSAMVPPDVVQHSLIMAAQGLGHLFGPAPPPGLPPHA
jgi:hypothetical protein